MGTGGAATQFEFGIEYIKEHFGADTPLATQQATHNLYRQNPERLVDHLLRCMSLSGRETVLDIGCGNGFILRDVVSRLRAGARVVALDISPAMLELARRNASLAWVPVEFVEGRAEDLMHYRDGEFDRVMANFIFHYIQDPDQLCSEMARVLADGGRAIVTIEARGSMREMYDLHFSAMERVGFPNEFTSRLPRGRRGKMVLENTAEILARHFVVVEEHPYIDSLHFEDPEPFMRFYAMGHRYCGSQAVAGPEISEETFTRLHTEVRAAVERQIAELGHFKLSKRNSVFVCTQ